MGKKMLKVISVATDIFEGLLANFNKYVDECDDINEYKSGYPDKIRLKVNLDKGEMICMAKYLNWYCQEHIIPAGEGWKQLLLIKQPELAAGKWYLDISGQQARKEIEKRVLKEYSEEEYKNILSAHCEEEYEGKKQQHYTEVKDNKLLKFEDVWAYDINNAHGSGLMELFPRCAETWDYMYAHRKDDNGKYKKYFNYYFGSIGKKNSPYRGVYWWVVHRTTRILESFWDKVGGRAIYINTDGIYLQHPDNPLASSDKLGEFKGKHGTIYTYRHNEPGYTPYWLIQFVADDGTVEMKSNIPTSLRDNIDLAAGKTIKFTKVKVSHHFEYRNMEEINV